MTDILLELSGVSKFYTGNQSVVVGLNSVDLRFARGEFVAVTGESGSGKSTLAHVISGILPYENGEMRVCGRPTSHYDSSDWERYRREKISFISQSYGILPGNSVLRNVVTALRISGMHESAAAEKAEELLKLVELWELRSRRAGKLSSGQKQRLSIARALAKPAPILVADEPTGNLDPENSAKVMQLLAQAAKERLVILITHDFQEAEGLATRRIILQDGRVTVDTTLAPAEPVTGGTEKSPGKKHLSAYVARLQMAGRPVWSSLVLLFFALTAFGVFAFLGTFLMNLDDTATRIYDDSAFLNGDKTRLVIQRMDAGPFSQADWNSLLGVKNAAFLERNSYLADWQYAWRQDVDYEISYHIKSTGGKDNKTSSLVPTVKLLTPVCDFVQTVPLLPEGQEFLAAGRLPDNMYEVVLSGAPDRIGESFPVYLRDERTMGVMACVKIDVTVVGTTDFGSGLYFGDELSRVVNNYIEGGGPDAGMLLFAPLPNNRFNTMEEADFLLTYQYTLPQSPWQVVWGLAGQRLYGFEEIPVYLEQSGLGNSLEVVHVTSFMDAIGVYTESDGPLPRFVLNREAMEDFTEEELDAIQDTLGNVFFRVRPDENGDRVVDLYLYSDEVCVLSESLYNRGFPSADFLPQDKENGMLDVVGFHDSGFAGYALVTQAAFEEMAIRDNPDQVSLFITDYAYTDQVLEDVQELGFVAISPFRQGSTQKNPTLVRQRMTTLKVCLTALVAVMLLQVLVLKELFGVQTASFKLLADMGLGCADARRSVLWQILLFTILGQLLGFGGVLGCSAMGISRVAQVLRYLNISGWLILSAVHLGAAVLTALLVMVSIRNKVYPQSARGSDLDFEEVAEV